MFLSSGCEGVEYASCRPSARGAERSHENRTMPLPLCLFIKISHAGSELNQNRVSLPEPRSLQCCCLAWLRAIADTLGLGHIAIDGKTLCGSAGSKWGPLHLVCAMVGLPAIRSTAILMSWRGDDLSTPLVAIDYERRGPHALKRVAQRPPCR